MNQTTASACVKEGRLCIVGLHDSKEVGLIPFTHTIEVGKDIPDGPVDFGAEDLDEKLSKAIDDARQPMLATIEKQKMQMTAEQLVERARVGDQNAVAMISAIRAGATKGVKRAKIAFKMLADY